VEFSKEVHVCLANLVVTDILKEVVAARNRTQRASLKWPVWDKVWDKVWDIGISKRSVNVSVPFLTLTHCLQQRQGPTSVTVSHASLMSVIAPRTYFHGRCESF